MFLCIFAQKSVFDGFPKIFILTSQKPHKNLSILSFFSRKKRRFLKYRFDLKNLKILNLTKPTDPKICQNRQKCLIMYQGLSANFVRFWIWILTLLTRANPEIVAFIKFKSSIQKTQRIRSNRASKLSMRSAKETTVQSFGFSHFGALILQLFSSKRNQTGCVLVYTPLSRSTNKI